MDTMREGSPKFTRRSFLKKSLLGTGALALSQVPFGRPVYAATGPVTLTYWHGWTGEWKKWFSTWSRCTMPSKARCGSTRWSFHGTSSSQN